MTKMLKDLRSVLNVTVVIAGLGYFVDLFDLTLFAVVRRPSLQALGVTDDPGILSTGILIYNVGLIGMMVGGVLWGVLADRKGRLSVIFGSIGLTIGDMLSGLFSQALRSRRRAIGYSLAAGYALMLIYCLTPGLTSAAIHALSLLIGITVGYWAVLVTVAAEQFGTNIRGTVATTVPNFVRGSAVFATMGFAYLKGAWSVQTAVITVGSICFGLALLALTRIDETFGRDLDFTE